MEQQTNSPFFRAVADALDAAKQLRTTDDSILMVMADGVTASHLCGGNGDHLQAVLLNFMQRNPKVAEIVLGHPSTISSLYSTRPLSASPRLQPTA